MRSMRGEQEVRERSNGLPVVEEALRPSDARRKMHSPLTLLHEPGRPLDVLARIGGDELGHSLASQHRPRFAGPA